MNLYAKIIEGLRSEADAARKLVSKLERDLEHMSQTKAHQLAPIVAARRVGPRKTGVPAPGGAEESTVLTEKLEEHMLARGVAENAQLEAESLAELMRVEVVAPSAVFPVPLGVPLQLAMLVTPVCLRSWIPFGKRSKTKTRRSAAFLPLSGPRK